MQTKLGLGLEGLSSSRFSTYLIHALAKVSSVASIELLRNHFVISLAATHYQDTMPRPCTR